MSKKIENFEWTSLLDLSGKGLSQYNAVGQNLNCSQLMRNAELDFTVALKPVEFTSNDGQTITDKKLKSLIKDDKEVLTSGLTDQYHPMQNESLALLGDHFASKAGLSFEHCFS